MTINLSSNDRKEARTDDIAEFMSTVGSQRTDTQGMKATGGNHPISVQEKSKDSSVQSSKMWAVHDDKHYSGCDHAVNEMPAGQYTVHRSDAGIYFSRASINMDDVVHLQDAQADMIMHELETFWTKEQHFRKLGFLWKRGILMFGPPGSGKTTILQTVSSGIVQRDGISIYVKHPGIAAAGLELLRRIEPARPIVVMLEDVDAIIDTYGESELLALMDGELQIDNIVFVATTNYPERLDKRFANRPSRFDTVIKVGMPSSDTRRQFLTAKCPHLVGAYNYDHGYDVMDKWVELTKDFSIAHIKELIISVEVFEIQVETAAKRLRSMITTPVSSADSKAGNFGFTS